MNLAIAGKFDFLKKTNPWGSAEDKADEPPKADPAQAARDIKRFMERNQAKRGRAKRR